MNGSKHLVGRLAQLRNIESKPELNESYVLVQSFLSDRNRFSVKTIPCPTADHAALTLSVKLESLLLFPQSNFPDKYPQAIEIYILDFEAQEHQRKEGTVLLLDYFKPSKSPLVIDFVHSHRVLGRKAALDCNGVPNPTTMIAGDIHICLGDEDGIIEVEDILFAESPCFITCTRGNNITFRRCSFLNAVVTVSAGRDLIISTNSVFQERGNNIVVGSPKVVFENCIIYSDTLRDGTYGVYAGCDGTVTLLNCVVRNRALGVAISKEAHGLMVHCKIDNCIRGAGVTGKDSSFKMLHCLVFRSRESGIDVNHWGGALIESCKVITSENFGIHVCGRDKHTCHVSIRDCHIAECVEGLRFEIGKMNAQVISTTIRNCTKYGLFVLPAVTGNVELRQCRILGSTDYDVLHGSVAGCSLTVDGVLTEPKVMTYELSTHLQLFQRRCYQQAGICDINCEHCGKKEAAGEKFKMCAKCENVCYCSKECQKTNWKEHKENCKRPTYQMKL